MLAETSVSEVIIEELWVYDKFITAKVIFRGMYFFRANILKTYRQQSMNKLNIFTMRHR